MIFCLFRKLKLEGVEVSLCGTLWNSSDFDWVMQKSIGNLGGLLCIWNKKSFVKQSVIERNNFIRISGEWGNEKFKYNFVMCMLHVISKERLCYARRWTSIGRARQMAFGKGF